MALTEISAGELSRLKETLQEHDERLDSVEGVAASNREALAVLQARWLADKEARDRMDTGEMARAEKGNERMWSLILLALSALASVTAAVLTARGGK